MQRSGRVVILNGASSVGKTTLARTFTEARALEGDCWITVGLDDFLGKLPWQWFQTPRVEGPEGETGVMFRPGPDGLVVRVGELGARLLDVYRRSVATWSTGGFNVLVDEVAFDHGAAAAWDEALAGLPVTWVAVRCDPEVAEARERTRGDRDVGLTRGLAPVVHTHLAYDLELDTTDTPPEQLAAELAHYVLNGTRPPAC